MFEVIRVPIEDTEGFFNIARKSIFHYYLTYISGKVIGAS